MKKELGIYIHVPLCKKKCNYCDFYSVNWNEEVEEAFTKCIIKEISNQVKYNDKYYIDTIYFGGGTPSIIKEKNIYKIMNELYKSFSVDDNAEISIEANPKTINEYKLKKYLEFNINRISIGVQSLNNETLKSLGRIHNKEDAINAIKLAEYSGFENINADIMYNIPGQTISDLSETIKKIIDLKIKHISFYSLTVVENTPLFKMVSNKEVIMPEEEFERDMYYLGRNIMLNNDIYQYEISNFSLKGYECKHNLKYWKQKPYIGFGPSAHSNIDNIRYNNVNDIGIYCNNILNNKKIIEINEILNNKDEIFEYVMLRLRLTDGLCLSEFKNKFGIDFYEIYEDAIKELTKANLIVEYKKNIKLTLKGMDLSNYVFRKFLD